MLKRIVITGGIACGKSTVGRLLEAKGYAVVDADVLVHQLLAHDLTVQQALRTYFGTAVFDEKTDQPSRTALAERVFSNPQDKTFLEGLLHPLVRERMEAFFQAHQDQSLAFALIPLFFEGGSQGAYDDVWCVACDESLQIQRMQAHRQMSLLQIQSRLRSQWPLSEKIKHSNRVLWNNTDPFALEAQVEKALQEIQGETKIKPVL